MLTFTIVINGNYVGGFEYLKNFEVICSFPFYSMLILLTKLIIRFTNYSHTASNNPFGHNILGSNALNGVFPTKYPFHLLTQIFNEHL
jgi:hypothetical protein